MPASMTGTERAAHDPAASETFQFDPFDPETRRDPYAIFARARREHPVFPHAGFPVVSVFRYADVQRILKDPTTWSNNFTVPGVDPEDLPDPSMLGQDPPEHTRLRGLVNQAFTPRIVQGLEARMHAIAGDLVAAAVERGEVDLVEALTYPLPVIDRKSTRLNSSHIQKSRMPSSA